MDRAQLQDLLSDRESLAELLRAAADELGAHGIESGTRSGGFLQDFSEHGGLRHPLLDELRDELASDGRPEARAAAADVPEYLILDGQRFPELAPAQGMEGHEDASAVRNRWWGVMLQVGGYGRVVVQPAETRDGQTFPDHGYLYVPAGMDPGAAVRQYCDNVKAGIDRGIEGNYSTVRDWLG